MNQAVPTADATRGMATGDRDRSIALLWPVHSRSKYQEEVTKHSYHFELEGEL